MRRGRVAGLVLVALLAAGAPPSARATTSLPTRIQFTAPDGTQLIGHLHGTAGPGVVLAPMAPTDQRSWAPFAAEIGAAGYRALTFDPRGYGGSEGPRALAVLDRDVEGAVRYLLGRKIRPIVLLGASAAGTASLVAAARLPVAGVAALSAPVASHGLDAESTIGKLDVPLLVIAARGDATAARAVAALEAAARAPTTTLLADGSAHGTDLLDGPAAAPVRDALRRFLADVAPPSTGPGGDHARGRTGGGRAR